MRPLTPQPDRARIGAPLRIPLRFPLLRPWLTGALIVLFALPALLPFLTEGLPRSFDGGLHLLRLAALDRLIRTGVLYPRWVPELLLGFGYPLFSYYAPASYYLAELFVLLGAPPYWALIVTFALVLVAAGGGMYLLARDLFGARHWPAALAAAVAYLYAPYLLTNIFIRGAVAEAAAQALLPWILWSARRLCRSGTPHRYYLPLAFSLAALALTHNITLLFLPPLLLAWLLLHWWLGGRRRAVLLWALAAIITAAAISAFFWLPLFIERAYLAATPYEIARSVWLPASAWTWANFLDAGWHYTLTFARPIRLGLVQVTLALLGFLLARRRDAEWLFLAAVAILTALAITAWALPLWLNSDILTAAQFTWRLLSILSLILALLTGGILLHVPRGLPYALVATALFATLIFAHLPSLSWMDVFAPETTDLSPPVFAQTERELGALVTGEGSSQIQEFRPRWAGRTLTLDPASAPPAPPLTINLLTGNAYDLAAHLSAPVTTTLRLSNFYFPGWQVMLDGAHQPLNASTNLGLLTVEVPPGAHQLTLTWAGTPLQSAAALFSLVALAVAAVIGWRLGARALAVFAGVLILIALLGWAWRQPNRPIVPPQSNVEVPGVQLLGVRLEQPTPAALMIYPYWYVATTPPDLAFTWQLRDAGGATVAAMEVRPYFNTYPATNWPPATLVDDAQRLNLPPGLPAGDYTLWLAAAPASAPGIGEPALVGPVQLAATVPESAPFTAAAARFGDNLYLDGYDILAPPAAQAPGENLPVVTPGDHLRLRLHWHADGLVERNDHGFVHLLDHQGQPLVQEDQLPGPLFQPPMLWDANRAFDDIYLLRIPQHATSGLYWPSVGLYDFATEDRLPIIPAGASAPVDDLRLPPLKVVAPIHVRPTHPLNVDVGDFARLTGYDLAPADASLRPGAAFTATLYFDSQARTGQDLIRFVQLYNPNTGVVAQFDGPPQHGANPTWAWQPGETVRDEVGLTLAADAPPGDYTLYAGLYDPQAENTRVPLTGGDGQPLADSWVPLATITVQSE